MQIFFLNGLSRFSKNGHLCVKLHSSVPQIKCFNVSFEVRSILEPTTKFIQIYSPRRLKIKPCSKKENRKCCGNISNWKKPWISVLCIDNLHIKSTKSKSSKFRATDPKSLSVLRNSMLYFSAKFQVVWTSGYTPKNLKHSPLYRVSQKGSLFNAA